MKINFWKVKKFAAFHSSGFKYFLQIYPNGDIDAHGGKARILLNLELKNAKHVSDDYSILIKSAAWSYKFGYPFHENELKFGGHCFTLKTLNSVFVTTKMTESRPPSPYLELKPGARTTELNQFQLKQNREKIHRIRPRTNFFAEITYVTSPSEIWIRPCNHISDKLTIPFNQSLELEKNLKENVYVMTPLNEDILVRARIILVDNIKQKYLLRLIDHGKPVWRNANDIYEMKSKNDELRKYPWQAIPIVLQGIEPENGKEWTEAEVYFITNALSEFSSYFVIPTLHDAFVVNNDSDYLKASINGLNETEMKIFRSYKSREKDLLKTIGVSIADYYRILLTSNELSFYLPQNEPEMDFFEQQSFSYPLKYDDINEIKYQTFNNPCFTASNTDSSDSGSSTSSKA